MRTTKVWTAIIALGLIIGGLGIMSLGKVSETTIGLNSGPSNQPTSAVPYSGVTRTVLWEQFTNAKCSFCPATEAALLPALKEYGYPLVAPLFPHVWWPDINDSIWNYSNVDVFERSVYYGNITGVPYCVCDGIHVMQEGNNTDVYREYLDKALGDLCRFSISTTGNLTTETVSAVVEAHEVIPPAANLSIRFGFWENNIDVMGRFGDHGQYFTEYHWAMWDTLPDSAGEAVFPSGADPGDKAWFNRSFFIDPGQNMNASEVGVTVWIQDDNTRNVEQARVEDFKPDPPLATHDIAVKGLHVDDNPGYMNMTPPNKVMANTTIMVNGTVLNWGASNETDIEVNLTVNGTVEQTQVIPFLETGHGQLVTFNWTVPIMEGDILVGIEAMPNNGDLNLTNNKHEKTVNVERPLDFWVEPGNFDLQVGEGRIEFEDLKIGNNGLGVMDYDIDVGELTEIVGSWDWFNVTVPDLSFGNIYNVTTSTTLVENKLWMKITNSTELYYVVYESDGLLGNYSLIQENYIASSGTGEGWFSSGPMNVAMQAGKYYFIGASYVDNVTWGIDDDPPPIPMSFGTFETGVLAIVSTPPQQNFSNPTPNQPPLKQAVVTGDGSGAWLTSSHDVGILAPESNDIVNLTINTTTLTPGFYQTFICIQSNDYAEPVILVPFDLTVLPNGDTLISVQEGWNLLSLPLKPVDSSVPNALLDQDGDTTWTMLKYFESGTWRSWASYRPPGLNNLDTVNEKMGVWLYVESGSLGDGFINISGYMPASTVIDLKAGWNMVGYPANDDSTFNVTQLMVLTGATGVEGFNPIAPYHIEVLGGDYVLKIGEAYWIKVNSDTIWTVDW